MELSNTSVRWINMDSGAKLDGSNTIERNRKDNFKQQLSGQFALLQSRQANAESGKNLPDIAVKQLQYQREEVDQLTNRSLLEEISTFNKLEASSLSQSGPRRPEIIASTEYTTLPKASARHPSSTFTGITTSNLNANQSAAPVVGEPPVVKLSNRPNVDLKRTVNSIPSNNGAVLEGFEEPFIAEHKNTYQSVNSSQPVETGKEACHNGQCKTEAVRVAATKLPAIEALGSSILEQSTTRTEANRDSGSAIDPKVPVKANSAATAKPSVEVESTSAIKSSIQINSGTTIEPQIEANLASPNKDPIRGESAANIKPQFEASLANSNRDHIRAEPSATAKPRVEAESTSAIKPSIQINSGTTIEPQIEASLANSKKDQIKAEPSATAKPRVEAESTSAIKPSIQINSGTTIEPQIEASLANTSRDPIRAESATTIKPQLEANLTNTTKPQTTADSAVKVKPLVGSASATSLASALEAQQSLTQQIPMREKANLLNVSTEKLFLESAQKPNQSVRVAMTESATILYQWLQLTHATKTEDQISPDELPILIGATERMTQTTTLETVNQTRPLRLEQDAQTLSQRFAEQLGQRLVQQVQKGHWRAELELHPRSLGRIDVQLDFIDGRLEGHFQAHNQMTRDLLQDSLPRLREWLQQSGTQVANLDVNSGNAGQGGEKPTPHPLTSEQGSGSVRVVEETKEAETERLLSSKEGFDLLV